MLRHLLSFPLFSALILAGCSAPEDPVEVLEDIIPGSAMPLRLAADSTWVVLADFCPDTLPEEVHWIPEWGQGTALDIEESDGQHGVWIKGQPQQGFGALEFRLGGRSAHVPILASTQRKVALSLAAEDGQYEQVCIMGAFNGWSRSQHPMVLKGDGKWHIELNLSEGHHPYQLVADGVEMPDPSNPDQVDNGFGGFNSILSVEGSGERLELAAIGFGGNQVHDVRLLGTPGSRVWGWWENHLYATTVIGDDGTGVVRIPARAYGAGRTNLRLWSNGPGKPSHEVRIPLMDGIPIASPEQLTRQDWESQILYFMLVDRFQNGDRSNDSPVNDPAILPQANDHGGDLAGIQKALDDGYFDRLGVTALWISPITTNPDSAYGYWQDPSTDITSRFSGYHGYWPISNTAIDPRFGSRSTFDGLVDAAHSKDMNFLLDYVANHVHEAHPLYQEHPDWVTNLYLPDGRENTQLWDDERLTTWFDTFMPTLNLERDDVAEAMSDSAAWWVLNSQIDGFRHDATKHIPLSFWRLLTRKIKQHTQTSDRRIYQIGETYGSAELIGSYLGSGLIDAQFDFNLYDKATVAFGKENAGFEGLIQVANEGLDQYGAHHLMGTITGNQDRPRFASLAEGTVRWDEDHKLAGWTRDIRRDGVRGHQAMRMLTAFNMSMPGVPCIYQGDEYADVGGNDPDNRRMVRFDDLDLEENRTREIASRWAELRRSRMSMMFGQTALSSPEPQLLKITRQYLDESTTVFFNQSDAPIAIPNLAQASCLLGQPMGQQIPPFTALAVDGSL